MIKKFDKRFFDPKADYENLKVLIENMERRFGFTNVNCSGLLGRQCDKIDFGWLTLCLGENTWEDENLKCYLCTTEGCVLYEAFGAQSSKQIVHFVEIALGTAEETIRREAESITEKASKEEFVEKNIEEYEKDYTKIRKKLLDSIIQSPEKLKHVPPFFFAFDKYFAKNIVPTYELERLEEISSLNEEDKLFELKQLQKTIKLMKKHICKMKSLPTNKKESDDGEDEKE